MTARSHRRKPKNTEPIAHERAELEARYGQVWDTRQLARDFILFGIQPARLFVRSKNDGVMGRLAYQSAPHFDFNFQPAETEQRTA
jgi:hypothetical protein